MNKYQSDFETLIVKEKTRKCPNCNKIPIFAGESHNLIIGWAKCPHFECPHYGDS